MSIPTEGPRVNPGGPDHGHSANGLANGKARPADSAECCGPNQVLATAIVRLIHGRTISARTRKSLAQAKPPEWGDLASYIEDSAGFTPEKRAGLADTYLKSLESRRDKAPVKLIRKTLDLALKAAEEDGIDDEPDEPTGPPPFKLQTLDSRTFFAKRYEREWLVRRIAVAGQPCIIGGPKKTLKTSILVDLIIALATGNDFLGVFHAERPMRVGFFSGESGEATIQETARRVCESKGVDPESLDNIVWGFMLPQLSNAEHLAELARVIRENRLEVVIIDPLYLCLLAGVGGKQLDPANLYQMGPVFAAVAKTCLDAGATPCLVHHFRKARESPYEVPELEDLAFAGIQEFARQWVLLGRRKKYEPGTGRHELWLTVGGSSGHTGEWAVDVEEGVMGDDFGGRRWEVSVRGANDARDEFTKQREAAKVERLTERSKAKTEAQEKEDARLVVDLANILAGEPDRKASHRHLRKLSTWNPTKYDRIALRAVRGGWFRPITVLVQVSKAKTEEYPGYELIKDPGVIE